MREAIDDVIALDIIATSSNVILNYSSQFPHQVRFETKNSCLNFQRKCTFIYVLMILRSVYFPADKTSNRDGEVFMNDVKQ